MGETIVMLHGFGGTHRAWDGVVGALEPERYLPLAIDLPGHGAASDAAQPITFAGCVAHVLANAPERFILCGYSLGGRVALHVALAAPERVARLVLISCSAGIEDAEQRTRRRAADEVLASELEEGSFADFIERWRTQPLFAEDPPEVARLAREDQRRNRPEALAAVLRGVGAGQMQPLWERICELEMPANVVVGQRDRKYLQIGRRMAGLLPAAELSIVPGGHDLLHEQPRLLAAVFA